MNNELQTLRLFSPLFPHIYPFNEWGDLENDMVEMDADELLQYTEEIQALIQKVQLECQHITVQNPAFLFGIKARVAFTDD